MVDSQRKLNCALFRQLRSNSGQVSLIKNFPKARKSRGNLSLRSDEPVSAYERRQIIEWSDFSGAVAACGANFSVPVKRSRTVFYGEFDSGSERTLAAWIRHASRTRLTRLAIIG